MNERDDTRARVPARIETPVPTISTQSIRNRDIQGDWLEKKERGLSSPVEYSIEGRIPNDRVRSR